MKRFAVALAALALAAPALAQDTAGRDGTVGLGVSIVPLEGAGTLPTIELYVPIKLAPQLRLEPSIGIQTSDRENNGNNLDTSDVTLGLGVFFVQSVAAPLDFYAGGRLKLNFTSWDDGVNDDSGTDVIIAGALGGEYYLVPKFSLGLEGQLGYYSRSEASYDEASGFFTTGLAFLRLYF